MRTSGPLRHRDERGMVTAEIAFGMTTLGLVLAAGLWMSALAGEKVRCQDAARDVARAVARGESQRAAREEGSRAAPDGARIRIAETDGWAEVVVSVEAGPGLRALDGLSPVEVWAEAAVAYEPGVGGATVDVIGERSGFGGRVPEPGHSEVWR